jgi:hypothetical protein
MSELLPPRDPKMLLTEVTARIKIKDIQRLYELRDRVAVKWYESGLVALLFVAALTFLAIVLRLVPNPNPLVRNFVAGSSIALIVIVTAILEFLLWKFSALRTLYEQQSRMIEELDKDLAKLRHEIAALVQTGPEEGKDGPARSRPD